MIVVLNRGEIDTNLFVPFLIEQFYCRSCKIVRIEVCNLIMCREMALDSFSVTMIAIASVIVVIWLVSLNC